MGVFSRKIGIDLGTSRTRIIMPRRGVVLDQPSVVAREKETSKVIAVGDEALQMAGKTPESIVAEYPLQRGVVADFGAASKMLKQFMQSSVGRVHVSKPEAMISVSMTATSTEQRAVVDVGESAGAQNVHLIQPPVAAALGTQIPISEARGNMVIDIGAGTTEIAVISLGGIVSKKALRIGGKTIDEAIFAQLRRNFGIVVGGNRIEEAKQTIGCIGPDCAKNKLTLSGRSHIEGLPKSVVVHEYDLSPMITPVFDEIVRAIRSVIEQTPPELVGDIKKNGILLTGGTSKLKGLDGYLTERLNTSCNLADRPTQAVVRGTKVAMSHLEDYKRSLLSV